MPKKGKGADEEDEIHKAVQVQMPHLLGGAAWWSDVPSSSLIKMQLQKSIPPHMAMVGMCFRMLYGSIGDQVSLILLA